MPKLGDRDGEQGEKPHQQQGERSGPKMGGGSEDDSMSDLDDEIDIAAEAEEEEGEGDEEGNGDEEKKGEDGDGDHNDMNDESNDALDELSDATEAITDSISIATGDLATKFEIFINFLQVYGLLVSFNLSIKWPVNWDYFSKFFFGWLPSIFIIDFDYIYRLADIEVSTDVYVYLMFGGIVSSVMVALGLYFYFHGLSKRKFIKNNIDNWGKQKCKFLGLLILSAIIAFAVSMLIDVTAFTKLLSGDPGLKICGNVHSPRGTLFFSSYGLAVCVLAKSTW